MASRKPDPEKRALLEEIRELRDRIGVLEDRVNDLVRGPAGPVFPVIPYHWPEWRPRDWTIFCTDQKA